MDSRFLLCSQKAVGGTQSCGKNYLQSTWGGAVVRMCQKDFLSLCHAGFVCNCFVNQTQNCFHLQNTKLRIRRKDIIKGSGRTLWLGGPSWRRKRVPAMYQYLYHQEGTHVTSSMTAHLGRLSLLFLVCLRTTSCRILYFFYINTRNCGRSVPPNPEFISAIFSLFLNFLFFLRVARWRMGKIH